MADRTSDDVLLALLKAGDEQAFRMLVDRLSPVLLRLARSWVPTAAAAEDVVQDTWLTVVDKLDAFEGRSALSTWVCGICVNKARRAGTRERRTLPFSAVWRDEHAPAVDPSRFSDGHWASVPVRWDLLPEAQAGAAEVRRVVRTAIEALPAAQREVITARDVLGMDGPETAEALGLTLGNQRVLLHRARSRVRTALERYNTDEATAEPVPDPVSPRR